MTQQSEKINQPFDLTQVEQLNKYQENDFVPPYTCGSGNRQDAHHLDGEGKLVATVWGWHCPFCNYRQDWALQSSLELADFGTNPDDIFGSSNDEQANN